MSSGGSRPGSGRPSAELGKKRVQVSISVSPKTMGVIEELRKRKVKVGLIVDELLQKYFEDNK